MAERKWYDGAKVNRKRDATGRLGIIEVSVPNAYGRIKSVQVRPGDTNEFLADIIVGLLYELESKDNKEPQDGTTHKKA